MPAGGQISYLNRKVSINIGELKKISLDPPEINGWYCPSQFTTRYA